MFYLLAQEQLWRRIRRGATPCVELLTNLELIAETEIGNLGVEVEVEQEILGLEISMNNLAKGHTRGKKKLAENSTLRLWQ